MNIHNRYSESFKVNFYEVGYVISTLSGINITMLVKFFSLSLLPRLFSGAPRIKWRKTGGLGAEFPAANRFLRFSDKKHSFKHTFYRKRTNRICS